MVLDFMFYCMTMKTLYGAVHYCEAYMKGWINRDAYMNWWIDHAADMNVWIDQFVFKSICIFISVHCEFI